jgi:hypothetical protein
VFILRIKNWDKFQHYKPMNAKYKKQMTWLKLYGGDILNDLEWFELSDTNKAIYIELLCLASQHEGNLPDMKKISFRLRRSVDQLEQAFQELGHWLEEGVYTAYIPEKSREEKSRGSSIRFGDFWKALLPKRRVNKNGCKEKWEIHHLDDKADEIIGWINKMKLSQEWKDGFNPSPEVIINQKRWEDGVININRFKGNML